jgi:IBR domain, a half RING-finger domain
LFNFLVLSDQIDLFCRIMNNNNENIPPKDDDKKMKIKTISIGAFPKISQRLNQPVASPESTKTTTPIPMATIKLPSFHAVLSPNVSKPKEVPETKNIPSISIRMPTSVSSTPEPIRLEPVILSPSVAQPSLKMPRIQAVAPSSSEASHSKPATTPTTTVPSITIRLMDRVSSAKSALTGLFAPPIDTPSTNVPTVSTSSGGTLKTQAGAGSSIRSISIGSARDREYVYSLRPKRLIMPDLLDAENCDFVKNTEEFDCPICFVGIEIGEGVVLKNCIHKFCKECLVEHAGHSEEYEVKCPFSDDMGICEHLMQDREVRALLSPEAFNKHLDKSLRRYGASESAFYCRTTDCPGIIEKDENLRNFTCEVCKKVNCIGCKAIHTGMKCQEYQAKVKRSTECSQSEATIKRLIETEEAMWCPKCGIPVMKVEGCDFITCTACKLGICWITKKPRQPFRKVNGDLVDGCHCDKKNGKPCHPLCKYCH